MIYTGTLLQGAPKRGGTFAGAKGTTVRQADKMATMSVGWDDIRAVGVKSTRDLAPRPVEAARQQVRPLVDQMFANWQDANETENHMVDSSRKEYKQVFYKMLNIAKKNKAWENCEKEMVEYVKSDDFERVINSLPKSLHTNYKIYFSGPTSSSVMHIIWSSWYSWNIR